MDEIVFLFSGFEESPVLISMVIQFRIVICYIPTNNVGGVFFSTSSPGFVAFLMAAILTEMRWRLRVICISVFLWGEVLNMF